MHTNEAAQARLSEFVGDRWNTNGGRNCTGACVKHTWQIHPGRWRREKQPEEKSPLQESPAGRGDNKADMRPIFLPIIVVFASPANSLESSTAFCGSFVGSRGIIGIQSGGKAHQQHCLALFALLPHLFDIPRSFSAPCPLQLFPCQGGTGSTGW